MRRVDVRDVPADGHRPRPAREPEEVLGVPAARPAGPGVPVVPARRAAGPGRLCASRGGGAGAVARGCRVRDTLAGRELALGGVDDARLPRRAAAVAARLPDGVSARLEAGDGPG